MEALKDLFFSAWCRKTSRSTKFFVFTVKMQLFLISKISQRERIKNINLNKTMNLILNLCSSNRIAFPGKNCKLQKVHSFIDRFYIESLTIMYISNPIWKNTIFQLPHHRSQNLHKNKWSSTQKRSNFYNFSSNKLPQCKYPNWITI